MDPATHTPNTMGDTMPPHGSARRNELRRRVDNLLDELLGAQPKVRPSVDRARALLCADCDAIFESEGVGSCPRCGSRTCSLMSPAAARPAPEPELATPTPQGEPQTDSAGRRIVWQGALGAVDGYRLVLDNDEDSTLLLLWRDGQQPIEEWRWLSMVLGMRCTMLEARFAELRANDEAQVKQRNEANSAFQDDVHRLLIAVGLPTGARPMSSHQVVHQEILPRLAVLTAAEEELLSLREAEEVRRQRDPNPLRGAV
jgi:hypothetical protein